ncbi:hypothetical protein BJ878DRAFT_516438 [Calycina marina]|uniref:Uncharacterized protein n=1 Tax=Calycina marina TaxID=1763456 RepID=A0A9P7YYQ5_9HELO|nr:hypothetical protein BJ878DRAFT_516438 [Calycina marina]
MAHPGRRLTPMRWEAHMLLAHGLWHLTLNPTASQLVVSILPFLIRSRPGSGKPNSVCAQVTHRIPFPQEQGPQTKQYTSRLPQDNFHLLHQK